MLAGVPCSNNVAQAFLLYQRAEPPEPAARLWVKKDRHLCWVDGFASHVNRGLVCTMQA